MQKTKTLKYPPTGLNKVSEAVCILFGQKANFSNFQKMLNENLFESVKKFDYLTLSDYDLKKLDEYFKDEDFRKEKIIETSKLGGILCEWTQIVAQMAKISSKVIIKFYLFIYLNLKKI